MEITTARVGDPGNAPVGIVPFQGPPDQGIYRDCSNAPPGCVLVGGVGYTYQLGEFEITVGQYVEFLNTVDPTGTDRHDLYTDLMSPFSWPKYGSITRSMGPGVGPGRHYSVAYPQWTNKPFGFANFLRAARFVNSLFNGNVLSRTVLVLAVPDRSLRPAERIVAQPRQRRRRQRSDSAAVDLQPRGSERPARDVSDLVSSAGRPDCLRHRESPRASSRGISIGLPGQPEHGRPGADPLPVGNPRPRRQCGGVD